MEVLIVLWLLCGVAAAIVFSNKGKDGCAGFVLGFFLGPIGLIIALSLSPDYKELEKRSLSGGEMRKCPSCAEVIKAEAKKCRFCGTDLPELPISSSSAQELNEGLLDGPSHQNRPVR